jgi:hypothetical protein
VARLQIYLAALWWGSMSTIGFLVVPLLFVYLETPAMAGQMAAKLFAAQTWVSLACGLLLVLSAQRQARAQGLTQSPSPWVLSGMLLALLLEFVVTPHILARENLKLWHNLGSALYLAQCMCAAKALWDSQSPERLQH